MFSGVKLSMRSFVLLIWKLMVPPVSQKVAIFTNLGQGLSETVVFFLRFEPFLLAGFSDKTLSLSNQKSTFVLVSGFLAVLFSQYCPDNI